MAPIIRMAGTGTTTITTRTEMDNTALLRLMTWLSPAFPVGGFAYSSGLERAVHDGLVTDIAGLEEWIAAQCGSGALWNDLVILADAWRLQTAGASLQEIAELSIALAGSSERHLETTSLGQAFLAAAEPWLDLQKDNKADDWISYPVAVGLVSASQGIARNSAIVAFLHAAISQTASAAIRLGVIGQRQGTELLARLEGMVLETSARADLSSLSDLGSSTIIGDISVMRHEQQHSRLFRS